MTRRSILKTAAAAAAATAMPTVGKAASAERLPASAPISISKVGLLARDAGRLAEWYEAAVGLERIDASDDTIVLGAGGAPLLEIREIPSLRLATSDQAGLYHTAFLLPQRSDLARWVLFASGSRLPVDGASDHLVSEAIYLTDPEGNGVEIYTDRTPDGWVWKDGQIEMASMPLDFGDLVATLGEDRRGWDHAPAGTLVGHVHLRVGDAAESGRWWRETFGFDAVRARQGAVFLSTGGYHHHVAVNEWRSAGALRRPESVTGLSYVELKSRLHTAPERAEDPWGTEIRISPLVT